MPTFKFRIIEDSQKDNDEIQESYDEIQESYGGIMVECNTDSPSDRTLPQEDAVSSLLISIIFRL